MAHRDAVIGLPHFCRSVVFLLVGYGRGGQPGRIARGKFVAGGRNPWLGFAFGTPLAGPQPIPGE
jgi:hypothetical protein